MCGIVGIVDAGGVSFPLYYALYALQHRGQESAGISTFEGATLYTHKAQGLVAEVFNSQTLQELQGNAGIGHVRYPTTGSKVPENVQPFNFRYRGSTSRSPITATWSTRMNFGRIMSAGGRSSAPRPIPRSSGISLPMRSGPQGAWKMPSGSACGACGAPMPLLRS